MSFKSDCKKLPLLQKFANGQQRLIIFWSDGKNNDRVEGWSYSTLVFHLNKNRKYNLKRFIKIGLVNPKNTNEVLGVYDPREFEW